MIESDEIKRIPLTAIIKMKQANPGHHLCDVVRGLIENSIDARCSQIYISLENDGLSSIKVMDDGVGIPRSSLSDVCRFHSTSKIKEITKTEIVHGKSFGFTGSFLANLSCASTVKISTKYHKEEKSCSAFYEFNVMTRSYDSFEINNGTCVEIINYLSNFPVQRRKLRKNVKEINKMVDTVSKYAVVYSWIKFEVKCNDFTLLETPGNSDLFTNLVLMHKIQDPLKSFLVASYDRFEENVEVIIILSNPRYNYLVANNLLLRAIFLNGRLISAPMLKRQISKIYQDILKSNYSQQMPYFIFIKAPEDYTNDTFGEHDNDSEFNNADSSEESNYIKEEKCYYQKFNHFNFVKKLAHECYQLISDSRNPPKEFQIANDIRRIENKLINDHLCNPRIKDLNQILFHHPNQQQQPQPPPQNLHGIQVQSSLPVIPTSGMKNILASPQQQQGQSHSPFLSPARTLQEQQQKQQSQSTSPFLATSRISSQQSLQELKQNQVQVQLQPQQKQQNAQQTILTPKHTVHTVAKNLVIKKSVSPAPTATFNNSSQQQVSKESSTNSIQSPITITDPKIQRNSSVQSNNQQIKSTSTTTSANSNASNQPQTTKPTTRLTDLLTNNAPQSQNTPSVAPKRVVVRKITSALLNSSNSSQNASNQQQQQNHSTSTTNAQSNSNTQNTQNNAPPSPVIRIHKVVVPPKNS